MRCIFSLLVPVRIQSVWHSSENYLPTNVALLKCCHSKFHRKFQTPLNPESRFGQLLSLNLNRWILPMQTFDIPWRVLLLLCCHSLCLFSLCAFSTFWFLTYDQVSLVLQRMQRKKIRNYWKWKSETTAQRKKNQKLLKIRPEITTKSIYAKFSFFAMPSMRVPG